MGRLRATRERPGAPGPVEPQARRRLSAGLNSPVGRRAWLVVVAMAVLRLAAPGLSVAALAALAALYLALCLGASILLADRPGTQRRLPATLLALDIAAYVAGLTLAHAIGSQLRFLVLLPLMGLSLELGAGTALTAGLGTAGACAVAALGDERPVSSLQWLAFACFLALLVWVWTRSERQASSRARKQQELAERITATAKEIHSGYDLHAVLTFVGRQGMALVGAQKVVVMLRERPFDPLRVAWSHGVSEAFVAEVHRAVAGGQELSLSPGPPRVIEDVRTDPWTAPLREACEHEGIRCTLILPFDAHRCWGGPPSTSSDHATTCRIWRA